MKNLHDEDFVELLDIKFNDFKLLYFPNEVQAVFNSKPNSFLVNRKDSSKDKYYMLLTKINLVKSIEEKYYAALRYGSDEEIQRTYERLKLPEVI